MNSNRCRWIAAGMVAALCVVNAPLPSFAQVSAAEDALVDPDLLAAPQADSSTARERCDDSEARALAERAAADAALARSAAEASLALLRKRYLRDAMIARLENERTQYGLVWPIVTLTFGVAGLATGVGVYDSTDNSLTAAVAFSAAFFGLAATVGGILTLRRAVRQRRPITRQIELLRSTAVAFTPVPQGAGARITLRF